MVMRTLNAARRIILLLLLIPVVFIFLDAVLEALGAKGGNPIVSGVDGVADFFIHDAFTTVFEKQSPLQDAVVSLVCYGVLALIVVFVFKGLQSAVTTRPPRSTAAPSARPRSQSAPPPAPTAPVAPAAPAAPATDKPAPTPTDTPAATKSDEKPA